MSLTLKFIIGAILFFLVCTVPFDVLSIKAKFAPFAIAANVIFGILAISTIATLIHDDYVDANDKILSTKEITITKKYIDASPQDHWADYAEDECGTRYFIYSDKVFDRINIGDKAIVEIHSLEEPKIKSIEGCPNTTDEFLPN